VCLNGIFSDWAKVDSGVPQGSVLGPLLFLVYVNDMDSGIGCNISKFADGTKIFNEVGSEDGYSSLQSSLDKLKDWSEMWQMQFNADKCKVLHFGKQKEKKQYKIGDSVLADAETEKDLGVYIQDNLKPEKHIDEAVKKANRILGQIYRTMEYKSKENILPLYLSLVRPHLEYCVQAWSPYLKKDITKLEKVQKRALNMIVELKGLTYIEKLKALDLFSLEKRRTRGDLIETFKILNGIDKVDSEIFFTKSSTNTRGHSLKLFKQSANSETRKNYFAHRVVDSWNRLPAEVVEAKSIDVFKNKLDSYFKDNNIL
jgi:hypothetical protein